MPFRKNEGYLTPTTKKVARYLRESPNNFYDRFKANILAMSSGRLLLRDDVIAALWVFMRYVYNGSKAEEIAQEVSQNPNTKVSRHAIVKMIPVHLRRSREESSSRLLHEIWSNPLRRAKRTQEMNTPEYKASRADALRRRPVKMHDLATLSRARKTEKKHRALFGDPSNPKDPYIKLRNWVNSGMSARKIAEMLNFKISERQILKIIADLGLRNSE